MKKLLSISILAIMLILMGATSVKATTKDTIADELMSMLSKYGMRQTDKVKVERYSAEYNLTEEQANKLMEYAKQAAAVMEKAKKTNYMYLSNPAKEELKDIAREAAKVIDVTLVFREPQLFIYKNGKLIEVVREEGGILIYTGNNNIVLVVSSIAIIALISAFIARKKLANA